MKFNPEIARGILLDVEELHQAPNPLIFSNLDIQDKIAIKNSKKLPEDITCKWLTDITTLLSGEEKVKLLVRYSTGELFELETNLKVRNWEQEHT